MSQATCLMWTRLGSTFSVIEKDHPCQTKGHSGIRERNTYGSALRPLSSAKALGSFPHSGILGNLLAVSNFMFFPHELEVGTPSLLEWL